MVVSWWIVVFLPSASHAITISSITNMIPSHPFILFWSRAFDLDAITCFV